MKALKVIVCAILMMAIIGTICTVPAFAVSDGTRETGISIITFLSNLFTWQFRPLLWVVTSIMGLFMGAGA